MMRHVRRFLAAALTSAILLTIPAFAASADGLKNFQPVNTYTSGTFRDVPASSWYGESVGAAYELGLM